MTNQPELNLSAAADASTSESSCIMSSISASICTPGNIKNTNFYAISAKTSEQHSLDRRQVVQLFPRMRCPAPPPAPSNVAVIGLAANAHVIIQKSLGICFVVTRTYTLYATRAHTLGLLSPPSSLLLAPRITPSTCSAVTLES